MITQTKNQNEEQTPLEQLKAVLLKQSELIQNGRIQDAQELTGRAAALLPELVPPPAPQRQEWTRQCRQVYQLYQKMTLMIEAQKAALKTQQQKISSGKKTMRAYRSKRERRF